ncbi:MAG: Gfo/Idh/MocA family oxidoreductase [Planctomycetes bacterium]|nr:Gfo/Idh/MocA family oxidoreductase [Planctomycetota bacterium]MCG2682288.1 Gfo/Idh/MocA family oxidoreductase [Planctomycetales bacterium]
MKNIRISRRSLLKGAAVAAPFVIASTALGNADTPPASERVTLGHIGVGGQGGGLFREFQNCKGMQSVAVADTYKDRREAFARVIKGKIYGDFRDILARNDIDAVVIATPDHWHVPIAILAAQAKKDAYVEKPLGLTIEQDLACQKVFAENGRVFQYGTMQRSYSYMRFGCELVRSGRIGKVHAIEVTAPAGSAGGSTKEIPVPTTLNYDLWLGPAPLVPYTADRCKNPGHFFIHDYSIGYLAGWGAHPLDIMIWGNDSDQAGPITVEGTGVIPTGGLYDNVCNWDMRIQFGDGVRMTFKPGGDSTKFIGSDGWVRIWRGGIDAEPKSLLTSKIGPNDVHLIDSPNHYQNFLDSVKSRRPTVSPLDQAVRSDVISQLCDIAVRTKRKITWDSKTTTVVGDAEAAKMMHRDMRAPWTL